jgi:hypothetical protein
VGWGKSHPIPSGKFQTPSTKFQTNSKLQAPNSKRFGIWNLGFGISLEEGTMDTPSTDKRASSRPKRSSGLLLIVLAAAFVIVSFMFWHETWFGRQLSDQEILEYLQDDQHPHKIQHALSQIADHMVQGDSGKWYPQIITLAHHPQAQIRATTAWVMAQDSSSQEFHHVLLEMLHDPELMVRRNVALGLVRFGDLRGRPVLVKMLQSCSVRASEPGIASIHLAVDQPVSFGTLLAYIRGPGDQKMEIRSPLEGRVRRIMVEDGSSVSAGDEIMTIDSDADQVWEALRGLYLVGLPEDLPEVERYAVPMPDMPDRIRQQAVLTANAIRTRAARKATP